MLAFELNLTSVIFASAASATSSAQFELEDTENDGAYTMRYDANGTWGTAKISNDKSKISSTNIQSGTYFVAQTNRDVKKVEIADQKSINASDWGLTTFENCKV